MPLDSHTVVIGLAVFAARIIDQSMSAIRTIAIVQGRKTAAFFLGFLEVCIWLTVISQVLVRVKENPWLGLFYALGFSTGNYVGIALEQKLAIGSIVLRVISSRRGREIAEAIRETGHAVTTFSGEGRFGPVLEVLVVMPRRLLPGILARIREIEPDAFYVTEPVSNVSRLKPNTNLMPEAVEPPLMGR